ncbi:E3 ubiquitin-protein ligase ATL4 [Camellia lanceoleosa]|uniref:E3 ubiquitin-protein ligase ATL4 n=1 Tax=Camellia lanceoleosa TaxID=1840588 RepID=A0ACC0I8T7_9ERIC|nr:E3 ubiquitin-protein ligase ATL4 [Camellia lanceoleosa]
MPRVLSSLDSSPPFLTVVGGTTTTTATTVTRPHLSHDEPSSSSASASIMIVIIIIASAIIVSASLYLFLRCLTRHCHRTFSAADVVSFSHNNNSNSRRVRCSYETQNASNDLISSLPVFTFGSVTGNLAGGDCSVCLSKFETNDQLRLLPLCCHAFHAECIDAWLSANQTCPLCRSTVHPTEADVLDKILSSSATVDRGNSFRIEIGNLSQRREASDSIDARNRRSYSIGGSFEYIVDDSYEVSVGSTHRRGVSAIDKDSTGAPASVPEPPGENLAAEVAGRSWLRDYMDRLSSISSRTMSFRSSSRFFTGSSRRSDAVVAVEDLEGNRVGEEISEIFRWLSGV